MDEIAHKTKTHAPTAAKNSFYALQDMEHQRLKLNFSSAEAPFYAVMVGRYFFACCNNCCFLKIDTSFGARVRYDRISWNRGIIRLIPFLRTTIMWRAWMQLIFRALVALKVASALAMTVFLVACATQATMMPADQPMSAEQGGVAFRLTVTGVAVSQNFTFWQQVELRRLDGPAMSGNYLVAMSDLGAIGSATYFGALPEGQYEVSSFSSKQCGAMCLSANLVLGDDALRFRVEKGKINYLGNLIYHRFSETGARLIPSVAKDSESFRAWLQAYYPANASMPLTESTSEGDVAARDAAYRQAQDAAAGLLNPVVVGNGDVLFTSLSGSIRRLEASTSVTTINTGIGTRVNAVLPLGDKLWLVGGDFGELKLTRDGGGTWENVKVRPPFGAIRGLYRGKPNEVIAIVQQRNRLTLYAGNVLEAGAWSEIASSDFEFDLWRGGLVSPLLNTDLRMNRILVALPGASSYVLDANTYERTAFEFPGGVMGAGLSGDGILRCRCNKSGMWVSTWESRDLGKTWQDSSLDRTWPVPQFRDANLGLNTIGFDVHLTEDGGASWKNVYPQEKQYWPFLFLPYTLSYVFVDEQKVVATDGMYEILLSEDSGHSWRRLPSPVRRP